MGLHLLCHSVPVVGYCVHCVFNGHRAGFSFVACGIAMRTSIPVLKDRIAGPVDPTFMGCHQDHLVAKSGPVVELDV